MGHRYQIDSVERWMGLGSARESTWPRLASATASRSAEAGRRHRPAAGQARRTRRQAGSRCQGDDFCRGTRRFLEQHSAKWDSAKHRAQWGNTLRSYAEPIIGKLRVARSMCRWSYGFWNSRLRLRSATRLALWETRPETGNRLRGRIKPCSTGPRRAATALATTQPAGDHLQGTSSSWPEAAPRRPAL